MLTVIILGVLISNCFCIPVLPDTEYEDSIHIQPQRNSNMPPHLCLLPWPFSAYDGAGKIYLQFVWFF